MLCSTGCGGGGGAGNGGGAGAGGSGSGSGPAGAAAVSVATPEPGQAGRVISAEGMTTLPSGLRYREIRAGTGASPAAADEVEVHYRGCFEDGRDFDSSYARGQTTSFPVNRVIAGWTEALQLMKEGARWELCIPYQLAYGEEGRPPTIPPRCTLYFEVELIKVKR